eukprot:2243769-Rhodomonas_salina.1
MRMLERIGARRLSSSACRSHHANFLSALPRADEIACGQATNTKKLRPMPGAMWLAALCAALK